MKYKSLRWYTLYIDTICGRIVTGLRLSDQVQKAKNHLPIISDCLLHLQTSLIIRANGMVFEPTSIEHEKISLHEIIDSIITKNIGILKPAVMFSKMVVFFTILW